MLGVKLHSDLTDLQTAHESRRAEFFFEIFVSNNAVKKK
jgi:hypothetical protein